jgi:uncharacterized surface protein with fasciclin (FAS1) repeats
MLDLMDEKNQTIQMKLYVNGGNMMAMKTLKLVSMFLFVALAVSAIMPATARAQQRDSRTIVGIAVDNPDFSTLVYAVQKAGLVDALNGNKQYTVFAPTNDAFDDAAEALLGPGKTGPELVDALPVDALTDVLLYHVTRGNRLSQSLFPPKSVDMLNGDTAMTSVMNGKAYIAGAEILATDIRASNGVIHVIGAVMLPPAN